MKGKFTVPEDLGLLRQCTREANNALNCEICPLQYLSMIQNAAILGTLCLCIAECYARALDWIDQEERRVSDLNGRKTLNISASAAPLLQYSSADPINQSTAFPIQVMPSE